MRFRLRYGTRTAQLDNVPPTTTLEEFRAMVQERVDVRAREQRLRFGFPPRDLTGRAGATLDELGIPSNIVIDVAKQEGAAQMVEALPATSGDAPAPPRSVEEGEDAELQRALALSLEMAQPAPAATTAARESSTSAAGSSDLPLVRRVIPSDNSCLFTAVGLLLERRRDLAARLRAVIAECVRRDPERWSEAVLGKPPAEYCRWIQDPQRWGGEIELVALSEHYGVELVAIDVQTLRCYRYGSGPKRAFLLYDGIHYDAIAMPVVPGASEEFDVSLFDATDTAAEARAQAVAREAHERRQFTDLQGFSLRCMVCDAGLVGQKGALEHAKATGHSSFGEIAKR